jgi:uncharacterized membrane protein
MAIMALDHVRDYFSDRMFIDPVDLDKTTPALFFTRWITHYCAPTFVFLAGVGALLGGRRGKTKPELAWFLLTRGVWLAFLEITVIHIIWAFDWDPYQLGAGVFWPLGWGMIVLSALIFLPTSAIAVFGFVLVAFHNLFDNITAAQLGIPNLLWQVLHNGQKAIVWQGTDYTVTFESGYCLIPWVGVMALGYCFGNMLFLESKSRRREIFGLGAALTVAFIVLRALSIYGDRNPWVVQGTPIYTLMSFLNCWKYPPSLMYLLMTLGPTIMALALFDQVKTTWLQPIITFGRVPLFFYLLHIPLIHGSAVILDYIRFGWSPLLSNGPWFDGKLVPLFYGVSLPIVYGVWIGVLVVLYPLCRWYADFKKRSKSVWLSYL